MYNRCDTYSLDLHQTISFPTAGMFELSDRQMVQIYIDKYAPMSCEYNFANLFCWQEAYQYSWRLYKGRLVIYDGVNQCAFMPLGEPCHRMNWPNWAGNCLRNGLEPNIGLVPETYVKTFPRCEQYFSIASGTGLCGIYLFCRSAVPVEHPQASQEKKSDFTV
jgi:uncharacterized protein